MSYVESSLDHKPAPGATDLAAITAEPLDADPYETARPDRDRAAEGSLKEFLVSQIDDCNLARYLDEETLRKIGMAVVDEYKIDEESRAEWVQTTETAMRLARQKSTPKQFPWPGASSVIFPILSQAAVEFNAKAYPALIQGRKVVKSVVWGDDKGTPAMQNGQPKMNPPAQPGQPPQPVWLIAPGERRARASRVSEHMSWQLLVENKVWEEQTDQLLTQIPVTGGAVRKTFRNHLEKRNDSLFVSLMNMVWNYDAPSFNAAPRHTEKLLVYPGEIENYERAEVNENGDGMWLPLTYGPGDALGTGGTSFGFRRSGDTSTDLSDPQAPHLFLEQHRCWDLDGDGYDEPYVVTVHERSCKVVRIVARYEEAGIEASEDGDTILRITPEPVYTLIPFFPSIDGGSYPMGFGHLLYGLGDQVNSSLNQMFDAGTLQNAGGGLIGESLGMPSGQTLFQVGKWHRVVTKGQSIRDAVFPVPAPGPSPVLFQLLGVLLEAAKGFAGIADILAGDASIANAPPTTVLALIEQGLRVYTAIYKRVYRAFAAEFDILFKLNRKYIVEDMSFVIGDEEQTISPHDYQQVGSVVPVADPSMVTDMQRLTRAQILMDFKDDPLINQLEIRRRLFEAADMDRVDDLFQAPDPNAQQMQLQAAQLEMALKQAELGRLRAAEQKDETQAFLNLALARKNSASGEETWLDAQLEFMRLRIEAINSTVKAAAVDHKFHDTGLKHARDVAKMLVDAQQPSPGGEVQPTPGPTGPFPVPPQGPPAAAAGPTPGSPGGPTAGLTPLPNPGPGAVGPQ